MYAQGALSADRRGAGTAVWGGGVGPASHGLGSRATANVAPVAPLGCSLAEPYPGRAERAPEEAASGRLECGRSNDN